MRGRSIAPLSAAACSRAAAALDTPLAARMVAVGTRIRPGMIVALDRAAGPPTIRWRFETRPVEALSGDRLTILGREHPYVDRRPEAERATPIRVGDMVSLHFTGAGNAIEVLDTVVDGWPRHPEFFEATFPQIAAHYQVTDA